MRTLFFICLSLLFWSCKEDFPQPMISGTLHDTYTKEPIVNARITVLENGPETTTDNDGYFAFETSQLMDTEKVDIDGITNGAISIHHNDYRPIELNIPIAKKTEIKLVSKGLPVYGYHEPVQLNDGLETANVSDVSMDRQVIQNMMDEIAQDGYKELHSLLIYKDGKLVLEDYFFGNNDTINFEEGVIVDSRPEPIQWTRNTPHYVASVNKALTSTLVGIALDQNNLSTATNIASYLPAYSQHFDSEPAANIDFESCLTMTAGFQWDEWGSNDLALLWKSDDFAEYVLSRNNMGIDSEWRYNSALPNLLLKALDNMVAGDVRSWAHDNFYEKLGITNYNWQSQPDGYPEGAARMYITPRDMLKVGITYLQNGQWQGEQVIPAKWVEECLNVKKSTDSGDYSYYFWMRELKGVKYLSADGDGGNYINIFPEQNMVVVFTQGLYLKWPSYVVQADKMMGNYILPSLE